MGGVASSDPHKTALSLSRQPGSPAACGEAAATGAQIGLARATNRAAAAVGQQLTPSPRRDKGNPSKGAAQPEVVVGPSAGCPRAAQS